MTDRDTHSASTSTTPFRRTLPATLTATDAFGILATIGVALASGWLAPGDADWSTWARLLAAWAIGAVSLGLIATATFDNGPSVSPFITWGGMLVSIVLGLTLAPAAGAIWVILLIALLLTLAPDSTTQSPVFWTIALSIMPLWVWAAFDAWSWNLVLLPAIGAASIFAISSGASDQHVDSHRSRQLRSWIWLTATAAILVALGTTAAFDPFWVTLAATLAVAVAVGDLSLFPHAIRSATATRLRVGLAFVILGAGWLMSL